MESGLKPIVAIVTSQRDRVGPGGAPIFIASDEREAQAMATILSRITSAMVHDLGSGVYVLVKH